jgi:glutamate-1-semialdehyde aminotransferase
VSAEDPDSAAWPITTVESARLFARANAVSPGGVQGEGRSASPYPPFMTRGYLTGAHTTDDVDQVVEATVSFLRQHRAALLSG